MKREQALKDLMAMFTQAYNDGRRLNDQRYDDIVGLYSMLTSNTENFLNGLVNGTTQYDDLLNGVVDNLSHMFPKYEADIMERLRRLVAKYPTFDASVRDLLNGKYYDYRREEIKRQFDQQAEEAKANLIDRGLYNDTILAPTLARVEEARAMALNQLESDVSERRINLYHMLFQEDTGLDKYCIEIIMRLFDQRIRIQGDILDAAERIRRLFTDPNSLPFTQIQLRNAIVKDMLDFMERRTDGYPDLNSMANLASQVGMYNWYGYYYNRNPPSV